MTFIESEEIMKTLQYLVLLLAVFLLSIFDISAQTTTKVYNNKTYVFDSANKKVYRLSTARSTTQKLTSEHFFAEQPTPFNDIYKQILSTDRINELSGKISIASICCNPNGTVQSVEFLFMDDIFYTVEEIEQLEAAFLSYKFNMRFASEEVAKENRNYYFAIAYRFPQM